MVQNLVQARDDCPISLSQIEDGIYDRRKAILNPMKVANLSSSSIKTLANRARTLIKVW